MFGDPIFCIRVEQDDRIGYLCDVAFSPYMKFDSDPSEAEVVKFKNKEDGWEAVRGLVYNGEEGKRIIYGPSHWINKKGGMIRLQVVEFSLITVDELIIQNNEGAS